VKWKRHESNPILSPNPDDFPRVIGTNATSTGSLPTKDFKTYIRADGISGEMFTSDNI
jgi:hypothetical protein